MDHPRRQSGFVRLSRERPLKILDDSTDFLRSFRDNATRVAIVEILKMRELLFAGLLFELISYR